MGDFLLVENVSWPSMLVRAAQRLYYPRRYARYSHAALITDGAGTIVEALWRGVRSNSMDKYRNVHIVHVNTGMDSQDRMQARDYAYQILYSHYGWLDLAGAVVANLTNSNIIFGGGGYICSGLVANALERGPYVFVDPPADFMSPSDLAAYFKV